MTDRIYNENGCLTCGHELEWDDCWSCHGDGEHSLYDEDPLFFDEDDTEPCDICDGNGGWYWCPYCASVDYSVAAPASITQGEPTQAEQIEEYEKSFADMMKAGFLP